MEVKPGYKQTEVGVIPEEWKLAQFDTVVHLIDGDRGINYPSGNDFSDSGHCLFLNAGNVTKEGFRFSECAFITREKDERLSKGKLKRDDIVLTTRGTVGNIAYFDSAVPFEHIRINSGMVILRNASPALDTKFLYLLLQSHLLQMQIERLSFGSAQPQLTVKGISKFGIVVPGLPEQRAIAGTLSDVDTLIGALDQLIVKKRDLKQAAMQQLLTGQKRLPGFHGEWEVKALAQVCWFQEGPGVRNTQFTRSGVKLLNGTNIFQGDINLKTTERFIAEKEAYGPYAHFLAESGDIVIASSGVTIEKFHEKVAFVRNTHLPLCMNTSTIRFKPFANCLASAFLFQVLTSDVFKKQIGAQATGSAQLNFGPSHVAKVNIPLPELTEQTAIADVLSDMDAELAALEQRRDKTRALKQGMMQELLTGKTRLIKNQTAKKETNAITVDRDVTSKGGHTWAFNEAVVIAALATRFGSSQFPLSRVRYTKLAYLLHRHVEKKAEGYLKKAAGPYNPQTRYGGPEKIAKDKNYIVVATAESGHYKGFMSGPNGREALSYFDKWYGDQALQWLERFRFKKTEHLGLLATVDTLMQSQRTNPRTITTDEVRSMLRDDPDWKHKLDQEEFSEANITRAIAECQTLFQSE